MPLTADEHHLLRDVIGRRSPSHLALIDRLAAGISKAETEELRSVIADELLDRGLDDSYEHNEYGRRLERLIDGVGSYRRET